MLWINKEATPRLHLSFHIRTFTLKSSRNPGLPSCSASCNLLLPFPLQPVQRLWRSLVLRQASRLSSGGFYNETVKLILGSPSPFSIVEFNSRCWKSLPSLPKLDVFHGDGASPMLWPHNLTKVSPFLKTPSTQEGATFVLH